MGEETLEFASAFKAKHSLPTTHITSPSQTPSVRSVSEGVFSHNSRALNIGSIRTFNPHMGSSPQ